MLHLTGKNRDRYNQIRQKWADVDNGQKLDSNDSEGWLKIAESSGALSVRAKCRIAWAVSNLSVKAYASELGVELGTLRNTIEPSRFSDKQPQFLDAIIEFASQQRLTKGREAISQDGFLKPYFGRDAAHKFGSWLVGANPTLGEGLGLWSARPRFEPPRVCRRLFGISYAAMGSWSSIW